MCLFLLQVVTLFGWYSSEAKRKPTVSAKAKSGAELKLRAQAWIGSASRKLVRG